MRFGVNATGLALSATPFHKETAMPTMHEVDYEIVGDDMQFVKIELDPKEAVVAEAGGMMYIEDGI